MRLPVSSFLARPSVRLARRSCAPQAALHAKASTPRVHVHRCFFSVAQMPPCNLTNPNSVTMRLSVSSSLLALQLSLPAALCSASCKQKPPLLASKCTAVFFLALTNEVCLSMTVCTMILLLLLLC